MVRMFRITTIYRKKVSDRRTYQSKAMFDKWWVKNIATGPYRDQRIEFIAEELVDGEWVEINRLDNGKS